MKTRLDTINSVLRRVGLLCVVGHGDGRPITIEIITAGEWNRRPKRAAAARPRLCVVCNMGPYTNQMSGLLEVRPIRGGPETDVHVECWRMRPDLEAIPALDGGAEAGR